MIVGLSGYARSGKDEAAKVLIEEFGFERVAFADKLRDVLYQLNPIAALWDSKDEIKPDLKHYVTVQNVIDRHGWDGYKETRYGQEIRRLLQRLGTEAGRKVLGENIWVDTALGVYNKYTDNNIVVTDCRFPNEAQAIKALGGEIWRVNRKGVGPANNHPSELSLDDWLFDDVLDNDGTLDAYHDRVRYSYKMASTAHTWKKDTGK